MSSSNRPLVTNFSSENRTGNRSRTTSDSIETLNELASFLPKGYLNLRKTDTIPKKDEYLHKTATLAKPYLTPSQIGVSVSAPVSPSKELSPSNNFVRSTSLRSALKKIASNNTKKMVRFADSMGLDLDQTCRVQSSDDKITQLFVPYNPTSSTKPRFAPLFLLPSVMKIDRLLDTRQVCLESVAVGGYFVKGNQYNITLMTLLSTLLDWKAGQCFSYPSRIS